MPDISHRMVEANGIRIHVAEGGTGPLVVLCHGFPETWYSWRGQLRALSEAGYRAVAPDMRGYGQTEAPADVDKYTLLHLIGDMVGLVRALGEAQAVIVGHDMGSTVAWNSARVRPDMFRAVASLSVSFRPRAAQRPTLAMPRTPTSQFYQLYYQTPGAAEAEFERDPRRTMRNVLYWGSGDAPRGERLRPEGVGMVLLGGEFLQPGAGPETLPGWLSEADVDAYAEDFARTGFRGGLNWYRNIDRNWELMAPFEGLRVSVPALYVAGDRDLVVAAPGSDQLIANLKTFVPELKGSLMLPGCGHWTQQERPGEVSAALIEFLRGLP